jgi:uncharacterized protein
MVKKIDKIRELVKNEAEESDWKYHILPVVKYAKELAKIYVVDEEVIELAALLHDIGRIKFNDEDHHISGAIEAEKILEDQGYSTEIIKEVKHCIESHRGSQNIKPETISAKIIANADAMSHFDSLPIFFYWRKWMKSFEEVVKFVDEKFERDWNKKITLPEAKKMIEEKYKAVRLLINTLKEYTENK